MSLKVYNLSHTFTQFIPEWPSTPSVNVKVSKFHAKDGVYEVEWEGIMHRCTHMDAPLHVTENTPSIADYPLWRLVGTGVCVDIPKGKWGVITPEDLENATPAIEEGDIVMINTGFHRLWADTDEYFAYGCGMGAEGAQWLVDKKVKMVGYGYSPDYYYQFAANARALSEDDLSSAATRHILPDQVLWLVVGDVEQIEQQVRALGYGEIVFLDADGNPIAG